MQTIANVVGHWKKANGDFCINYCNSRYIKHVLSKSVIICALVIELKLKSITLSLLKCYIICRNFDYFFSYYFDYCVLYFYVSLREKNIILDLNLCV